MNYECCERSRPLPLRTACGTIPLSIGLHGIAMTDKYAYIAVSSALKRLRSDDYTAVDEAMRAVAWDSIMSSGTPTQRREANAARDAHPFRDRRSEHSDVPIKN